MRPRIKLFDVIATYMPESFVVLSNVDWDEACAFCRETGWKLEDEHGVIWTLSVLKNGDADIEDGLPPALLTAAQKTLESAHGKNGSKTVISD